jgi:outer membrane protein assembly factor BamB
MNRRILFAALLLGTACGADEARPPCTPGDAACAAPPEEATDPRIVGPGMRGLALPHWPMFHHDGQHSGRNGVAPPPAGVLQWTFATEGEIMASPAVAMDGTIYIGSLDHRLYAVSPRGKLKWSFETLAYIFSSPAVAGDGTVYVGSVDAHLYAIRDGVMKWSAPVENCAFSSPALGRDGTIYVGSNAWKLYAVRP